MEFDLAVRHNSPGLLPGYTITITGAGIMCKICFTHGSKVKRKHWEALISAIENGGEYAIDNDNNRGHILIGTRNGLTITFVVQKIGDSCGEIIIEIPSVKCIPVFREIIEEGVNRISNW